MTPIRVAADANKIYDNNICIDDGTTTVTVSVTKSTRDTKLGLTICGVKCRATDQPITSQLWVTSISNSSMFHNTELRPGMIIMMINGSKYKDYSAGLEMLQSSVGNTTIVAAFPRNHCIKQTLAGPPVGTTTPSHFIKQTLVGPICTKCKTKVVKSTNNFTVSGYSITRHWEDNGCGGRKPNARYLTKKLERQIIGVHDSIKRGYASGQELVAECFPSFTQPRDTQSRNSPFCSGCGYIGLKRDVKVHLNKKMNCHGTISHGEILTNDFGFCMPVQVLTEIANGKFTLPFLPRNPSQLTSSDVHDRGGNVGATMTGDRPEHCPPSSTLPLSVQQLAVDAPTISSLSVMVGTTVASSVSTTTTPTLAPNFNGVGGNENDEFTTNNNLEEEASVSMKSSNKESYAPTSADFDGASYQDDTTKDNDNENASEMESDHFADFDASFHEDENNGDTSPKSLHQNDLDNSVSENKIIEPPKIGSINASYSPSPTSLKTSTIPTSENKEVETKVRADNTTSLVPTKDPFKLGAGVNKMYDFLFDIDDDTEVTVNVTMSARDTSLGLGISKVKCNSSITSQIRVAFISKSSIFHNTKLRPDMIITMINGSKYSDFSAGLELLQSSVGNITIVAAFPRNHCIKQPAMKSSNNGAPTSSYFNDASYQDDNNKDDDDENASEMESYHDADFSASCHEFEDNGDVSLESHHQNCDDDRLSKSVIQVPLSLSLPDDHKYLSAKDCYIRSHLVELFEANDDDVKGRHSSRRKMIFYGQIGIRCIYCKNRETRQKFSVMYPSQMEKIRKCISAMTKYHFEDCEAIPVDIKRIFATKAKSTNRGLVVVRDYWVSSAQKIGLMNYCSFVKIDQESLRDISIGDGDACMVGYSSSGDVGCGCDSSEVVSSKVVESSQSAGAASKTGGFILSGVETSAVEKEGEVKSPSPSAASAMNLEERGCCGASSNKINDANEEDDISVSSSKSFYKDLCARLTCALEKRKRSEKEIREEVKRLKRERISSLEMIE